MEPETTDPNRSIYPDIYLDCRDPELSTEAMEPFHRTNRSMQFLEELLDGALERGQNGKRLESELTDDETQYRRFVKEIIACVKEAYNLK